MFVICNAMSVDVKFLQAALAALTKRWIKKQPALSGGGVVSSNVSVIANAE